MLNLATYGKSQTHYVKGMRPPRRATTVCKRTFSLFHPLPGFFTFPHGTGSLSVISEYLALEVGSHVQSEFHVFRPTRDTTRFLQDFAYGIITL